MKNCDTCKFWTPETKTHNVELPLGRCALLCDYVATLENGNARWDNALLTQCDFGCVKHKDAADA